MACSCPNVANRHKVKTRRGYNPLRLLSRRAELPPAEPLQQTQSTLRAEELVTLTSAS
jgi:hypothetical protein